MYGDNCKSNVNKTLCFYCFLTLVKEREDLNMSKAL